jgi:hypothetical protein
MRKPIYTPALLVLVLGFIFNTFTVIASGIEDIQRFELRVNLQHSQNQAGLHSMKLEVDVPVGTQLVFVGNDKLQVEERGSTTVRTDGKIDVDIIIRENGQAIPLDGNTPLENLPHAGNTAYVLGEIDVQIITVDNISGVYEVNPNQPVNMQARIFDRFGNEINTAQVEVTPVEEELAVTRIETEPELVVYPNPAPDGIFNLQIKGAKINGFVAVHNSLGAVVGQLPPSNFMDATEVRLEHLPKGVYYIKVPTTEGELIKKLQITR